MTQILFVCVLVVANAPHFIHTHRHPALRVLHGRYDLKGKYPFVVALVSPTDRVCIGTMLLPEWVLTAAHCIQCGECYATHIQYGNMSVFPDYSKTKKKIIQFIRHPGYRSRELMSDIALLRVEPVSMKLFGKLSAIDYSTLIGQAVEYAGFGATHLNNEDDNRRPLVIGTGVVRSCIDLYEFGEFPGPYLCVAPKCSNKNADSATGDSGGPLFYDSKIVGIVTTGLHPIGIYTSVSPFMAWIREVMNLKNSSVI